MPKDIERALAEHVHQERELALRESRAKSAFLSRISHELRTPLNAVLGLSQLLVADEQGQDAAALSRRRRLEHIHGAGKRLLAMVDDVLELSALDDDGSALQHEVVPLPSLLSEVVASLAASAQDRDITLQLDTVAGEVRADRQRLRKVLRVLLSHALRREADGGQVRVGTLAREGTWLVCVTDSGPTLDAHEQLRAFDGDESKGASGVGLSLVREVVQRMGGSIAVRSGGGGTSFELRLQAAPDWATARSSAARSPDDAVAELPGPRATLLYIEDNSVNALIVAELVKRHAALRLHIATTGSEGVELATRLRPDLILLDMQLPDFDGFEVLRRLQREPALAARPVIALSANAMPKDIERALAAGVSAYWTKPLDFAVFRHAIDSMFA